MISLNYDFQSLFKKMFESPIHQAVRENNLEELKTLLKNGGDVEEKEYFYTPLHTGVEKKCSLEVVECLLQNGADPNAKNRLTSHTVLGFAIISPNNTEILKLLVDYGVNLKSHFYSTILNEACKNENNIENIRFLISHGASINKLDQDGKTPLHNAIKVKHNLEVVQLLVENGANVNAKDSWLEYTPLHQAVQIGNNEVTKFLIENGANIKAKNFYGYTPFFLAVKGNKSSQIIKLLLKYGAELDTKSYDEETPFSWAVGSGESFRIIKLLLEHGAYPYCSPQLFDLINHTTRCESDNNSGLVKDVIFHLILLKMLNLITDEQFSRWKKLKVFQHSNYILFEKACEKGANKLRNELICADRTVTFADILIKDLRTVAFYLNVDDIQKQVSETNLIRRFPVYSAMLEERINKATELADFLRKGYESLKFLLEDNRLPHTFLNQILCYLTENDIKNINSIYQSVNNCP